MLIARLGRLAGGLRQHGTWLLLEFVVVVAGLTLSLLLQDQAQAAQRAAQERKLLAAFADDLQADLAAMELHLKGIELFVDRHEVVLDAERRAAADERVLDQAVDALISYLPFAPHDVTYRTLDASAIAGSSHRELFREVIALHTGPYRGAVEWSDIDRHFVLERMIPFLDLHGPYVERAANPLDPTGLHRALPELVDDRRFLNLVNTGRSFKTGVKLSVTMARDAATALLDKLESFRADT